MSPKVSAAALEALLSACADEAAVAYRAEGVAAWDVGHGMAMAGSGLVLVLTDRPEDGTVVFLDPERATPTNMSCCPSVAFDRFPGDLQGLACVVVSSEDAHAADALHRLARERPDARVVEVVGAEGPRLTDATTVVDADGRVERSGPAP